ncbi:MAG: hypothetical protein RSE13_04645 [Planktothrix sp. GU0601_MAG3]|nr:MAG: hypothetical protein RSE13_04645 [Planktothrix sp. GU0601_MAG3]
MLSTYLQILSDSQPPLPTLDDFAQRINQEHKQCLDSPQTSLIHARNAGEWLLHVQTQLSPEHWQVWFQEHFTFSQQTATMYMQIAKKMPGVNPGIFSLAIDYQPQPAKNLIIPILPYSQVQNSTDEVKNISDKSSQILSPKPDFPLLNPETLYAGESYLESHGESYLESRGESYLESRGETRHGTSLPGILTESTTSIQEPLEILESPVTRIQINPKESSIDVEFTAINPPETSTH